MDHDTTISPVGDGCEGGDATVLLDLDGLAVQAVEQTLDGHRRVWLATTDETAAACPTCGVFSRQVKEYVCSRPRDLPQGRTRLDLRWRKRRWYCQEPACPRASFTESVASVPPRARITTRLREHAGQLVVDGTCATVIAAGRVTGLSWPIVMDAVRDQAAQVLDDEPAPVRVLGIDEVRRGRLRWHPRQAAETEIDPDGGVGGAGGGADPMGAHSWDSQPSEAQPAEARNAVVPQRESDQSQGVQPARARVRADRWHVGFTDLTGALTEGPASQGMLAQIEGRTSDDVAYWLAMQRPAWRHAVQVVAIDMCTVFVSAIRRYLPHAQIVIDRFHLVKLATDTVTEVRRRVTMTTRGRRGRASDPEWRLRNLLRRNREDLTDAAFVRLWNTLIDLGAPGLTILRAWIAKDRLRQILALTGTGADRSVISHRLYRFYTWCADAGMPELERLATTISTWWRYIEPLLATGITNAASEGFNRVVKLDARNAYGYRNPANQRLRTRCATTRRARGCLDPDQLR